MRPRGSTPSVSWRFPTTPTSTGLLTVVPASSFTSRHLLSCTPCLVPCLIYSKVTDLERLARLLRNAKTVLAPDLDSCFPSVTLSLCQH